MHPSVTYSLAGIAILILVLSARVSLGSHLSGSDEKIGLFKAMKLVVTRPFRKKRV